MNIKEIQAFLYEHRAAITVGKQAIRYLLLLEAEPEWSDYIFPAIEIKGDKGETAV